MRWFLSAFTMVACVMTAIAAPGQGPAFEETPFGKTPEGVAVTAYTLLDKNGAKVKIITYGGIIAEFHAPDKDGKFADIVLGFDDLKGYTDGHPFFGAITGRVANRIGLSSGKTPDAVEAEVTPLVPAEFGLHAHHWLILHGRYLCKARKPECWRCPIADLCRFNEKTPAP